MQRVGQVTNLSYLFAEEDEMLLQRKSAAQTSARQLHSIAGLLRERVFKGTFAAGGKDYQFTFAPNAAAIAAGKLQLNGSFSVTSPGGQTRTAENVNALLAATQGGLYASLTRPRGFNVTTVSPYQDLPNNTLPITEFTLQSGFVGVLYLKLSALNGQALGVPLKLNAVQLNARVAPIDETARDLQWLFSHIAAALYGERADESSASLYVTELDRLLRA